ncbi:MAG: hypothetical protein H7196_01240 [candidate division SR1 bacterium]|nr:hypothetical protein [candidate division SR1 bacterium]
MSNQSPTFTYYNKLNSNTFFVILHGSSIGIADPFSDKIYDRIIVVNQSYISIQMSFIDRGENSSSGEKH